MVNHFRMRQFVVGAALNIHHALIVPPAGKTNIRFARLTRPVYHATDNRHGDGMRDMRQTLFKLTHGLDHVKALPRAGRARDNRDTAMA